MTLFRRLSAALIATVFATALVAPALSPARATVQTSANKTIVLGDGVTTQFSFSFIGVAAAYITVIYTDAGGNETVLTQGAGATQYQITLNAPITGAIWGVGGKVTYSPSGTPIANGTTLTIFRTLPLTQAISLQNKNSLAVLGNGSETGLDTGVMQSQQISENISRAFTAPIVDATAPLPVPPIAQRANKGAAFDGSGNLVAGTTPSSGIISSAMQPVVDAATLALGRTAFGLGNIAVENIGSGLQDDGSGNVRVNTEATTAVATNQSVTGAFNNRSFIATGPITFSLARANTLWNGFSFKVYAFTGAIQLTPNAADNFVGLAGGASQTIPQNTVAEISTDAAGTGTWYVALMPRGVSAPQGYLTPCSGSIAVTGCTTGQLLPVNDVAAATTLYYQTGPAGSHIPLYNGNIMMMLPFPELSLTLNSNHLASTLYDVCVFNNGGVPTMVTGPAWGTNTIGSGARGASAAITRVAGYWTNSLIITGRNGASTYSIAANACTIIGTIYVDATPGQVSFTPQWGQSRKWGAWNFYNKQQITMQGGDPTGFWNYTTNSWRQANGAGNNFIDVMTGLPEERFDLEYVDTLQNTLGAGTTMSAQIGIGYNLTGTPSGMLGTTLLSNGTVSNIVFSPEPRASYLAPPSIGINRVYPIENGKGATAGTFFGASPLMQLSAKYRG